MMRTADLSGKAPEPLPFDELKSQVSVTRYFEDHFQRVGKSFACPYCGSGTGPNRSSAVMIYEDENRWRCYACKRGGDVFDLAGVIEHTEDRRAQLEAVARWAGVTIETGASSSSQGKPSTSTEQGGPLPPASTAPVFTPTAPAAPDEADEATKEQGRRFIASAQAALWASGGEAALEYARSRGFTDDEIRLFGFGSAYGYGARRLVIPWGLSGWYHTDRDISGRSDAKYTKPKGVTQPQLFDAGNLEREFFFVVEGPLDAYAIKACGYPAEALGSSGSNGLIAKLAKEVKTGEGDKDKKRVADYAGCVVISLDSDEITEGEAGRKKGPAHAAELEDKLKAAGVMCLNVTGDGFGCGVKDAGEALQKDRSSLTAWLDAQAAQARQAIAAREYDRYAEAMGRVRASFSADILGGLLRAEDMQETVSTGLKNLDKALSGGLHPGLTILGAFSSLGKTSLMVQLADTIAASGRAVLFVSIEQAPRELVAKSLARIARKLTGRTSFGSSDLYDLAARSSWAIDGRQYADFKAAADEYARTIAPWLVYAGGEGVPTVADVARAAELMTERTGRGPAVIVDYLQLLAPMNERDDDTRAVGRNVTALRQLSNAINAPVLAISSMPRNAYKEQVGMGSFRGSGVIEYSADLALGLQPLAFAERLKEKGADAEAIIDEEKRKKSRDLEIVVLKCRGYRMPTDPIPLYFDGESQTFVDRR